MKKHIQKILGAFLGTSILFFYGCPEVVTEPPKPSVNVPLVLNFSVAGSDTMLSKFSVNCLSGISELDKYDKNSAKFVSAAYWTKSASPSLIGDIAITIDNGSTTKFFTHSISDYDAGNNIDKPYTLPLSDAQKTALNNHLSQESDDTCIGLLYTISNITGEFNGNDQYSLDGKIEIIIELEEK